MELIKQKQKALMRHHFKLPFSNINILWRTYLIKTKLLPLPTLIMKSTLILKKI